MGNNSSIIVHGAGSTQAVFDKDRIMSLSSELSSSISGGEIAVDTLDILIYEPIASSWWTQSPRGTKIDYYEGETLIEQFYLSELLRMSKYQWHIVARSALGLLDERTHPGGVYGGETVEDLADEIIGNTFSYTVDTDVADWPIAGWLPYDTARANLHRLLLAMGLNILRNSDGTIKIGKLTAGQPIVVDKVYVGGSIAQQTPATSIAVTENQYYRLPTVDSISLFDNTGGTGGGEVTVIFDKPCFSLEASVGLTILSSGANYARLRGTGVLLGKPYTKTERIVNVAADIITAMQKEIRISDDGLINPLNSQNVANRILSYYSAAQMQKGRLVWDNINLRPGKLAQLPDIYGNLVQGYMQKLNLQISGTNAASFELISNYLPGHMGNVVQGRELITQSGTWVAPTNKLRIVLVGGGQGGQGGYDGEMGGNYGIPPVWVPEHRIEYSEKYDEETERIIAKYCYYPDGASRKQGGAGGKGGAGGQAGSVLVLDVEVEQGEILTFTFGTGGIGGNAGGHLGALGTASTVTSETIGSHSSDEGSIPTHGVLDLFGGTTYAAHGAVGVDGAAGGVSTATSAFGWDGGDGAPGEGTGTHTGGLGGAGQKYIHVYAQTGEEVYQISAGGGGGGGASGSNNGGNGGAATLSLTNYYWPEGTCIGGDGGHGANAAPATIATLGSGGDGGNGGGGGGDAGGSTAKSLDDNKWEMANVEIGNGAAGLGGDGSAGAAGGNGFALIYYGFQDGQLSDLGLVDNETEAIGNVNVRLSSVQNPSTSLPSDFSSSMSLIQIETVTPLVNNATDIEPTSIVVPALGRIETPNPAATYSEIEADMSMLVSSGKLPNATLDGIIETSVTESTAAAAEKFEFNDGELDLTEIFAVTPINSDSAIIDINTEHLNLTETDKNDTIIVPGQLTSAIRSYATLEDFCDKLILALITMVEVNNLDVIEFDSADSTTLPSKLFTVGNNAVDIELNGIVDKLDIQTLDGGNINADVSEKLLGIDTLHTNLVQCENQAGINNDSTVEITMWPQWYIFENGILTILQAFDYSQTGSRLDID